MVDLPNPEKIVIGSIYTRRQYAYSRDEQSDERSASTSLLPTVMVPAALGERIGDPGTLIVVTGEY
ncbi:hypothetical protein MASR1M31_04270 [Porphyromonadaceae bacterium]